jgi:hypothetical protein
MIVNPFSLFKLMVVVSTNRTGYFNYQLVQFYDPDPSAVVAMVYNDSTLQNCSVQFIQLALSPGPGQIQDLVIHLSVV